MMDFLATNFNLPTIIGAVIVFGGTGLIVWHSHKHGGVGCDCGGSCHGECGCSGGCSGVGSGAGSGVTGVSVVLVEGGVSTTVVEVVTELLVEVDGV